MKNGVKGYILIFLGIFLISSCVFFSRALMDMFIYSSGSVGWDKIEAKVDKSKENWRYNTFSNLEFEKFKKIINADFITYSSQKYTQIQTMNIILVGTNNNYNKFHHFKMIEGSFFFNEKIEHPANVIVINDIIAWELFRTTDVIGKEIEISGKTFKIIGVYSKKSSMLDSLISGDENIIYIPYKELKTLDDNISIESIEINISKLDIPNENFKLVQKAISSVGKEVSCYKIIDYEEMYKLINQKNNIYIFILGFIAIIFCILYVKKILVYLYKLTLYNIKYESLIKKLRSNRKELIGIFIKLVLVSAVIFYFWSNTKFIPYIPKRSIPNELSDISFYINQIKNAFRENLINKGYQPSPAEYKVRIVESIINILFYFCGFVGIFMFYLGLNKYNIKNYRTKNIWLCGSFLLLSILMVFLISISINIPVCVNEKSVSIIWVFTFINIVELKNFECINNTHEIVV